jgi:hypothetical protein
MFATMKKTLVLCAAACSTGAWLSPAAAAAAGSAEHRFLGRTSRRLGKPGPREALLHVSRIEASPLDSLYASQVAMAYTTPLPAGYTTAPMGATTPWPLGMSAVTTKPVIIGNTQVLLTVPPPPMPGLGAGLPTPPPLLGAMEAMLTTPAPQYAGPPPCNWTYDWEGVARPADCTELFDGNHTCKRSASLTFDFDPINRTNPINGTNGTNGTCIPPRLERCKNPENSDIFPKERDIALYAVDGSHDESIEHGLELRIVCSENATAVDHKYPLESWGQDWYPGVKSASVICNNGTIIRTSQTNETHPPGHPEHRPAGLIPKDLRCELKEKVDLTQDLVSYLRWTEPKMVEANTRGYKWIDMDAILRKKLLRDAMNVSAHYEAAAQVNGTLQTVANLKTAIKNLIEQRMVPRGEEYTQDTCKDLESHWLYQLENNDPFKKANYIGYANWAPPVNETSGYPTAKDLKLEKPIQFTCSYTVQKTAAGYDPYTGQPNYHYRDGCYCESKWTGGCPFQAQLRPSYQTFGFDALDIKEVSTSVGAATNALCWYFSKPAYPEFGYLRTGEGYSFQAPQVNVTELKRDWIKLRRLAQNARFKQNQLPGAEEA